MMSVCRNSIAFVLALACVQPASAQSDPLAGLTPEQKATFATVSKEFAGQHFAEALTGLKPLLAAVPEGSPAKILLTKYTAEAAINTGDRELAFALLRPVQAAFPNDWQAPLAAGARLC